MNGVTRLLEDGGVHVVGSAWRGLQYTVCVVCRTVMHRATFVCTVFDTSLRGTGTLLNFLKGQVGMCWCVWRILFRGCVKDKMHRT